MSQILIYQTDPSNNISPFIHFPSSFPIYSHTNINWSFLLYSYLCHNAMVPQKSIFIFHCISLTATLPLILWLYACYLYIYKNIRQFFTGYRRFKIIELCVNSSGSVPNDIPPVSTIHFTLSFSHTKYRFLSPLVK